MLMWFALYSGIYGLLLSLLMSIGVVLFQKSPLIFLAINPTDVLFHFAAFREDIPIVNAIYTMMRFVLGGVGGAVSMYLMLVAWTTALWVACGLFFGGIVYFLLLWPLYKVVGIKTFFFKKIRALQPILRGAIQGYFWGFVWLLTACIMAAYSYYLHKDRQSIIIFFQMMTPFYYVKDINSATLFMVLFWPSLGAGIGMLSNSRLIRGRFKFNVKGI